MRKVAMSGIREEEQGIAELGAFVMRWITELCVC